jgi:proteasome lid subunit RPN8/RPN11
MTLPLTIRKQALAHAVEHYPNESCGLIIVVKGRRRYWPCQNQAETPDEHFIIDPLDYAAAEDQGEVIAVVHSHPKSNPAPSQADRVACEKSGLPWHIVNPLTEQWGYCEPEGFELPYVGREFSFGVVDCWTLVRDFYQREYGIALHDYDRRYGFWLRGDNMYVDNLPNEGFRPIPVEQVQPGDLILMQLASPLPNHAAIYLGDQLILHHIQCRLSSRDVYGRGYYANNTVSGYRHEDR